MARPPSRITAVCTSSEFFLVRAHLRDTGPYFAFSLDSHGRLKFTQKASPPPSTATTRAPIDADAVFGVFSLLRGYYVALVTRSRAVACAPGGSVIFQVLEMDFVPLLSGAAAPQLSPAEAEEEALFLRLLRRVGSRSRSFYFSAPGYDLTNSLARNDALRVQLAQSSLASASAGGASASASASSAAAAGGGGAAAAHLFCDERFFWNRSACRELIAAGALDFVTPIINGFVGSAEVSGGGSSEGQGLPPLSLLLVSRRACTRVGTRFNTRGADADGNVANYVETEQLLLFGTGAVASYVQVRGSIPLLWEQPATMKYAPKCVLSPNKASAFASFQRHMQQQLERYGRVAAVSLIDKKGDQKLLGQAFSEACDKFGAGSGAAGSGLSHVWFDFHAETKGMKWQHLSKLLDLVRRATAGAAAAGASASAGATLATSPAGGAAADGGPATSYMRDARGAVVQRQAVVVRTNCMDNLDRTNVVQSLFARQAVLAAVPGAVEAARRAGSSVLTSPFPEFEHRFNNLWADNADALSVLYSGTGALKTDFTRTGKRTLRGLLSDGSNSLARYFINNLGDGAAQDAWDLFLGRYVPERTKAAAQAQAPSPARAHMAELTPAGLLVRTVVLFASLTAAFSWASLRGGSSAPLRIGASCAAVVLGGLAYLLVRRGLPSLGRHLVNKPTFVAATGRGIEGKSEGGSAASVAGVSRGDLGLASGKLA